MFTAPAQPPAVSYPHRVKRKPVPSFDFASLCSEPNPKDPIICNRTDNTHNSNDFTSELPQLSYINHKSVPLHALPLPAPVPVPPEDTSHIMPPWLKGHRSDDSKTHNVHIAPIRDASTTHRRHSADEPHYHRRTQSTPAIPFQAKSPSNPSAAPPPYVYPHLQFDPTMSKVFFPSSVPPISPEDISPVHANATYSPVTSRASSQNASDGHRDSNLPSISSHTQPTSDSLSASPTKPKEQKLARFLRPIRSSLTVGSTQGPQSESRWRKLSLRPFSGSVNPQCQSDPTPAQPLRPIKRNVLRSPRRSRRRVSSVNTGTTLRDDDPPLPIKLSVDVELRSLSQQKNLTPPLVPHFVADSRLKRNVISSHPEITPHSKLRRRSKHPTRAPAAFVAPIDENGILTQKQLSEAALLFVIAESGVRVPFGDLFLGRKTVVIFIRHFWCPHCQDYMFSMSNTVSPTVLKRAGVDLVVISNGSYNIIQSYRKIFRAPFAVYTDPTHRVFNALGMTYRTVDPGPRAERGAYIKHGVVRGITMVVSNAVKVKMSIWENGGDVEQLGGEFVLGPGLKCTFAHRMVNTQSHTPIHRVLAAAGVDLYARWEQPDCISEQSFLAVSETEEAKWLEESDNEDLRRDGETSYDAAHEAVRENPREESVAGARSGANFIVGDDVKVLGTVGIGRLSKATLEVVEQKEEEDCDESREKEDHQRVGSADIFPGPIEATNASSAASDAKSCSSSGSYWECCSHNDEA